ncbi:hypothetical protein [Paraburkholderia sacchari]|uniref:hypothetical protein n=1 Tax=Paraburkholderia sacchari TaxID=159450 RepID=UPI0015941769|nr:hypothetical protein [Paraburkholderia sacchari]
MQDGICGTATELAARVRVDARSVRAVLRMWLDAGIVHVVEEVVPGRARVFRYGGNEQPAGCLPGALRDRSRRGGGAAIPVDRWPQLDSELAAAVDAMVRVRGAARVR